MAPKKPLRRKSKEPARKRRERKTAVRPPPIVKEAVALLDSQKAENIRVVALDNHVADFFVIATASGPRHLHALSDHLIEEMALAGFKVHHAEGCGAAASERWVLLDFMDVIVHLFTEEGRKFYDLDSLVEEWN